jgi:hypothetical protein
LNNPTELSWRASVAATSAAKQAAVSTLEPRNVTMPQPFSTALLNNALHTVLADTNRDTGIGTLQSTPKPGQLSSAGLTAATVLGQRSAGTATVSSTVPESFWRTVAPDVHHEMLEYVYDNDPQSGSTLSAMLAALKARKGAAFWTSQGQHSGNAANMHKGSIAGVAALMGLLPPPPSR